MSQQLSRVATRTATAAPAAAGVVGWIDWLTIPGAHPARTPATLHGVINSAGLIALLAASTGAKRRFGWLAAATGGLLVAAWIGGDLVYRFGWRVRAAEDEVADFERHKSLFPAP